jgi:hypothetical protein
LGLNDSQDCAELSFLLEANGFTCGHDMFVGQIPLAEKVIRTIVVYSVVMVWEQPRRPIVWA